MKLKYSGIIEVKPLTDCPDWLVIIKGDERYETGDRIHIGHLEENGFTAADCEALNVLDPDRTDRLCLPIIG